VPLSLDRVVTGDVECSCSSASELRCPTEDESDKLDTSCVGTVRLSPPPPWLLFAGTVGAVMAASTALEGAVAASRGADCSTSLATALEAQGSLDVVERRPSCTECRVRREKLDCRDRLLGPDDNSSSPSRPEMLPPRWSRGGGLGTSASVALEGGWLSGVAMRQRQPWTYPSQATAVRVPMCMR